jgi:hypothetical protein
MVAIKKNRQARRRQPREAWRDSIPGVHVATNQEGRDLFDYQANKELGISGEEFLVRWDAGEYRCVADPVTAQKVQRLAMLMPFVRRIRA